MNHVVELKQATKRFGMKAAVDRLDLAVPEGSIYGFIGPNGSGKTTTIRMILRIFQPDSGSVNVLGQEKGTTADDRVGYLPEERGLYKRMKVRDVLAYYARLKGHYDCRADIDNWLERLDATSWATKRIDALSKGMAQKVQFISAVIARPQLVILDEPFSGLDPVNLEVLQEAVLDLRRQGSTVIFSTHDMDVAERMCDTIFMIFEGRKVLDGTLSAIQAEYPLNRARVRFASDVNVPTRIDGIRSQQAIGQYVDMELEDNTDSQSVLRELTSVGVVEHFELVRPRLHDIFVSIARPDLSTNGNLNQSPENTTNA